MNENTGKILEILNDIDDTIDYEHETSLVDDHILDSFGIISLVSELEETFDISIDAASLVPENFNSLAAIRRMVEEKQGAEG